jgi:hypothetical protein
LQGLFLLDGLSSATSHYNRIKSTDIGRGWETHDLWISADFNKPETEAMVMKLKGWKYRLVMPMEVNGVKKDYTFNFEITDIVKTAPPVTN